MRHDYAHPSRSYQINASVGSLATPAETHPKPYPKPGQLWSAGRGFLRTAPKTGAYGRSRKDEEGLVARVPVVLGRAGRCQSQ